MAIDALDAGHSVYRNVKSLGGVDRVLCKVTKQWEIRFQLRSTQSILEMIVTRLSFSNRVIGQHYQFSHSDNVLKRPNRFIKELDNIINNHYMS